MSSSQFRGELTPYTPPRLGTIHTDCAVFSRHKLIRLVIWDKIEGLAEKAVPIGG